MLSIEPGARQTYIEHLCFIIPLKPLRNTPNVQFSALKASPTAWRAWIW